MIKTTENEIVGRPTLADAEAKSLDLKIPQHEMQYHRGPKSPKFETLQTRSITLNFTKCGILLMQHRSICPSL